MLRLPGLARPLQRAAWQPSMIRVARRREARWRGMQEAWWARGCRRAVEACWLLVFGVVPVCFSVDVYINFIHDKIPLFRSLVELGLLAALLRALQMRSTASAV